MEPLVVAKLSSPTEVKLKIDDRYSIILNQLLLVSPWGASQRTVMQRFVPLQRYLLNSGVYYLSNINKSVSIGPNEIDEIDEISRK